MQLSLEYPASRLEFDGLTLRPLAFTDVPALLEAFEESLTELRRFVMFAHEPQSEEGQVERIRANRFPLGVFQQGRFLVSCGLNPSRVPLNPRGVEMGWWVRTSETGQGLATLTARVLAIYSFQGLDVDRLQVAHNPENVASARVIAKCGFQLEGRTRNSIPPGSERALAQGLSACRDVLTYALLPEEARAQPWFSQLAPRIQVFDLLGNDLGKPW